MDFSKYIELNRNSLADFHTHTTFADGDNRTYEMAEAAFAKGLKAYGFSEHGYTSYDEGYCMLPAEEAAYEAEVRGLAKIYAGRMEILCGVEQDCLAGTPTRDWDYVIGSVHYIDINEEIALAKASGEEAPFWIDLYPKGIIPIDENVELWKGIAELYFDGDAYAMIERYYETVAQVVEKTGADIIGHLDLITKYNAGGEGGKQGALFDEGHPRYLAAWQKAVDKLLQTGVPFEINTGGMTRGYRTDTYPAKPIVDYIAAHGGRFILSSDSHAVDSLCSRFEDYRHYLW